MNFKLFLIFFSVYSSSSICRDGIVLSPLTCPISTQTYISTASTISSTTFEKLETETPANVINYSYNIINKNSTSVDHRIGKVVEKIRSDRFNFASFDCGGLILGSNKEASGATSILVNGKDNYMLNVCSAKKFVMIELCQEILLDEIHLGNFEYFSSMIKDFYLFASEKYPPRQDWVLLGNFTALNVRQLQSFEIPGKKIWSKYIKLEFISEYNQEYYCPLSTLKVFGVTMIEDLQSDLKSGFSEPSNQDQPEPRLRLTDNEEDLIENSVTYYLLKNAKIQQQEQPQQNIRSNNPYHHHHQPLNMITQIQNPSNFKVLLDSLVDIPEETEKENHQGGNNNAPNMQESAFKNILKRLKFLEKNSRVFHDVFVGVLEKLYEMKSFNDGWEEIFRVIESEKRGVNSKILHLQKIIDDQNNKGSRIIILQTLWLIMLTLVVCYPSTIISSAFQKLYKFINARNQQKKNLNFRNPSPSKKKRKRGVSNPLKEQASGSS